ncbi:MAG TPA: hypothetical protein VJM46_03805 [Candidatus Saccharimonadales bacterium]|nr:hypothetical protein [Candidatus Saccharimonadales bacterium]
MGFPRWRRGARQVRPGVYHAQVTRVTRDGQPVADVRALVTEAQALKEHLKTCIVLGGHSHSIMLVAQHQRFPGNTSGQSNIYLGDFVNGVWKVFVLTRDVGPTQLFMMDPRLGDKWGRLGYKDGVLTLSVDTNPVDKSYYNN